MGSLKRASEELRPDLPATKVCSQCGKRKSTDDYYTYKKEPWFRSECKVCTRVLMIKRKAEKDLINKEKSKKRRSKR